MIKKSTSTSTFAGVESSPLMCGPPPYILRIYRRLNGFVMMRCACVIILEADEAVVVNLREVSMLARRWSGSAAVWC